MSEVLLPLAIFAGVITLGSLLVGWLALRRVRRLAARWHGRVLAVREACTTPGPQRDAARLRRRLHDEVLATQEMLDAAPDGLVFRADAGQLLASIGTMAAELDRDLRAVEAFRDAAQQKAALAGLGPQVTDLVQTSYAARQTMLRTAIEDRDRVLESLRNRVASQADAFDRYRQEGRELSL